MSVAPLPEALRSVSFDDDLGVLGGFAETYGFEPPVVRFGEDVWDFSAVPDRPAWLPAYGLVVRFDRITQPIWRLTVKELLCARLYPTHPAVASAVPNRRRRPAPLGEAYVRVLLYKRWLDWLAEHGIRSLDDVRQEHCDRYYNTRAREIAPSALSAMVILPLRELADYGPVLTDRYPEGFRPWGHRRPCHITGLPTRRPNATPVIPNQVLDPLLAGALFHVETAGNDVLAAREEHRRLSTPFAQDGGNPASPAENLQRLAQTLDEYRREGRPLPRVRDLPPETVGDPLARVNLRLLARQARIARLGRLTLSAEQRELLLGALDDLGTAPGGLRTPISEVTPFGNNGPPAPWRDPIGPWELRPLTARLAAACFCTIAALSGMRYSEIVEIRPGSIEPLDDGLGVIRWRLRSKLIKGQRHGGRPESWHVIGPVVDAIKILERMHPSGPDDPLLSHDLCRTNRRPPDKPTLRLNFGGLLRDLIAWQNTSGARAGLPPIPDVDGRQWPISPRQFRRTLAREIAFRPHGTIASKIQLKHVHAHVTEGYWGPAGESAQRFIDELDREQRAASERRIRQRFEEWQQGLPIAGGAQHRLQQEFTVIARELDSFTGTLDEREQRLRKLLRKRADTLHFGVLNDCHFTDPSQARCLKNASTAARDAPLIAACQPARCANASIHHDHLPGWRGVIAHAEELLGDPVLSRKVPRLERERIAQQRDEHAAVIAPLQAGG
jgi:hypothetical protein